MALRVYSGILTTKEDYKYRGKAEITFEDFIGSGDASLAHKGAVGGKGKFASTPCFVLGLHRIRHHDHTAGESHRTELNLSVDSVNSAQLVVTWDCTEAVVDEISFMVVGDAA